MITCVICDLFTIGVLTARLPSLSHRRNLESCEWKASQQVAVDLPSGCCVLVETDNDIFFYLARYQLYPSRAYRKGEVLSGEVLTVEEPDYLVHFMKDSLEVSRVVHQ
jgi:hypothetical protein